MVSQLLFKGEPRQEHFSIFGPHPWAPSVIRQHSCCLSAYSPQLSGQVRRMASPKNLSMLVFLGACEAIAAAANLLYLPAMPSMAVHFKVQPSALASSVSVFLAAFGAGLLLGGKLLDRCRGVDTLRIGLALSVVSGIVGLLAGSIWTICCARALHGLGAGIALVGARGVALDLNKSSSVSVELARLSLVVLAITSLAALFSGVVAESWGHRAVFLTLLLGGSALTLLSFPLLRHLPRLPSGDESEHSQTFGWATTRFRALTLVNALIYSAYQVFVAAAPFVVVFHFKLDKGVVAAGTTAMMIGYALGTSVLASGSLTARPRTLAGACILLQLVLGVVLGVVDGTSVTGPVSAYFIMTVVSFSHGILLPSLFSLAVPLGHRRSGTTAGLFYFAALAFSAIAVELMGSAPISGWWPVASFVAAAALLGLLLMAVERQPESPSVS